MQLTIQKSDSGEKGIMNVADSVFSVEFNEPLIHQVLTSYLAGARLGTKAQKTRAEVRGGGRKPFAQKGTGRARAGTIRSPIWRGGGITFAAKPKDHSKKLNKKMYRAAMRSIISELIRQERFICVDEFNVNESKTKLIKDKLASLNLDDVLIVTEELNENLYLGVRNIPKVDVIDTNEIDPYSLIGFDKVLMTQAAIEKVEAWLS
ncbi:50S ribosomal protein L4 [Gammaproteobacteria bacterium]|jgi:large subunit ribosomal protein L4|nr:50S ribosomal protein L4 [Gammaproteobacteria bacterium]|tara:strand:+ start:222 stop:839 length:618 start_codon:yes stop_codon:yes gene_type:complete